MESLREILTLWSSETRRTLRSVRALILLLLYAFFTLVVMQLSGFFSGITPVGPDGQPFTGEMGEQMRALAITVLFRADPPMVESLSQIPLAILFTFKATLFFLPLYIAIIGFDQLSGEVVNRSIRYTSIRARRSSILLGKYLAQQSVLVVLSLLVDAGLLVYARWRFEDFALSTLFMALGRLWLASMVFSLTYAALTALLSALIRQPVVGLVTNFLLLPPILLLSWLPTAVGVEMRKGIGAAPVEEIVTSPVAYLRYLSPWFYVDHLLHPAVGEWLISAGAHLGFAGLFLGLAYVVLRSRDL
ncbi:MAG: ABC transporter permease subunit [Myxococcaceae bacterium]